MATAAISVARELAAIAGDQHVVEDPQQLAELSVDGIAPGVAVSPANDEEVAAVLRLCSERDWVVVPAGGFTKQTIGAPPERLDVVMRTNRLNGVEHYDAGDLTVGAGAGTTLAGVDALLAQNGQWLPLDPARPDRATIGGVLATAAHGPLKHAFGGVREFTIGVRFVTGDGKRARGGGRVVKNVAGYDLMKLMVRSFGTLGVITAASFKVFPRPRQTATFVYEFGSSAAAMAFRDHVLASPLQPLCLEIVSPQAQEFLDPAQAPRSPDTHTPAAPVSATRNWQVFVRAAGSEAVLARYRRDLGADVMREVSGGREAEHWRRLSNFGENVAERHRNAMLFDVSVPIASVSAALGAIESAAQEHNFLPAIIGRLGVGSLVAALIPLAVDPPSAMQYANAASALRGALGHGASAVVTRCPREAKPHFSVWGPPSSDGACLKAVKRAMDPRGVLNRGRYLS